MLTHGLAEMRTCKKGDREFVKIKPPLHSLNVTMLLFISPSPTSSSSSKLVLSSQPAELFFASHPVPAVLFTLKKMYEQQICSRKIHYCAVYMPLRLIAQDSWYFLWLSEGNMFLKSERLSNRTLSTMTCQRVHSAINWEQQSQQ